MTNPDFSQCTHTRDGTEIVAGPWPKPQGGWCFVHQSNQGSHHMATVSSKGMFWTGATCRLDLIPPEPEYVYINVYAVRGLGSFQWMTKEKADKYAGPGRIGYLRKRADADGPIEHVNLDGELWAMLEGKE